MEKEELEKLLELLTKYQTWKYPVDTGTSEESDLNSTISSVEWDVSYYEKSFTEIAEKIVKGVMENSPKRISVEDFTTFCTEYAKGKETQYKNLRFGQAFMNKFYPNISSPSIYYGEDSGKVYDIILAKFVHQD